MTILSGIVLTRNGEKRLPKALASMQPIVDKLTVFIDDTTTDGSADVARSFGAAVVTLPHEDCIEYQLEQMHANCGGDWVLRVDDDEVLAGNWDRALLEQVFRSETVTHCWFARRWLVPPGDQFITTRPWHPDFQLRLIKNDPAIVTFPDTLHDRPRIEGDRCAWKDLFLDHWDFVYNDRAAREAKVEAYEEIEPGGSQGYYYLYEDYPHEIGPV